MSALWIHWKLIYLQLPIPEYSSSQLEAEMEYCWASQIRIKRFVTVETGCVMAARCMISVAAIHFEQVVFEAVPLIIPTSSLYRLSSITEALDHLQ